MCKLRIVRIRQVFSIFPSSVVYEIPSPAGLFRYQSAQPPGDTYLPGFFDPTQRVNDYPIFTYAILI